MNHVALARVQVLATAIQMREVFIWLVEHIDEVDQRTVLFIGMSSVTIARYCNTTMSIIDAPTGVVPEKHCIFF